jgi:uncharacterized membrane protein YkgB
VAAHDLPIRLSNSAILIWQGVRHLQRPEQTGEYLLNAASHSVPALKDVFGERPERFATALGACETGLGVWLLSGIWRRAAGVALAGFSSATLSLLFTVPGMREEGSVWEPSQQGMTLAKDLWMLGAAFALVLGEDDSF